MEMELVQSGSDHESLKSGNRSSGSELLSITEAAVKGLDKTGHSQSHGDHFLAIHLSDDNFHGASRDITPRSEDFKCSRIHEVLIQGASLDSSQSVLDRSSASSRSSFLSGEARPVKVSSKKLREIKSPFENSNNSARSIDANISPFNANKGVVPLSRSSSQSSQGPQKENIKPASVSTESTASTSKVKVTVEKHITGSYPHPNAKDKHHSSVDKVDKTKKGSLSETDRESDEHFKSSMPFAQLESGHKVDSGYSTHKQDGMTAEMPAGITLSREGTLDGIPTLQDNMIDVVSPDSIPPSKESSVTDDSCTSQPVIVTVPETIVTVRGTDVNHQEGYSSGTSSLEASVQSQDSGVKSHSLSENNRFSKYHPAYLRQGTLTSESDAMSTGTSNKEDVQISQYNMANTRQVLKDKLAKRATGGVVKKVVKPQIVNQNKSVKTVAHVAEGYNDKDPVTTAAVAAASAVAATQPFLKAQHDMEGRMADVLNRITALQAQPAPNKDAAVEEELKKKVAELEAQVAELGGKRLDSLERMQQQQLDFQVQLLALSRKDNFKPSITKRSPDTFYDKPPYTPVITQNKSDIRYDELPVKEDHDHKVLYREREKLMDTPAPRSQPPQPTALLYNTNDVANVVPKHTPEKRPRKAGLLEEILATQDETPKQSPFAASPPAPILTYHPRSPEVKRAGALASDLAQISQQLKQAVHGGVSSQQIPPTSHDTTLDVDPPPPDPGPAPLDHYLNKPKLETTASPYPQLKRDKVSHGNAPVINKYSDVEEILQKTSVCRNNLEANFDAILKAKQESEVYSVIEQMSQDRSATERLRMKAMVDEHIKQMNKELEKEILDDMLRMKDDKSSPVMIPQRDGPLPKAQNKGRLRVQAKVNTGLRKDKRDDAPVMKTKTQTKAKPKKPAKSLVSLIETEADYHHVYGKPLHAGHRSSPKEPYLRFSSTSPKAKTSPGRPSNVIKAVTKTRASVPAEPKFPSADQYYFNAKIDRPAQALAPPIEQSVPMAIPLAPPTVFSAPPKKMAASAKPGPLTSTPVRKPQESKNTALVTEKRVSSPRPVTRDSPKQLQIQVLPSVDIDSVVQPHKVDEKEVMTSDPIAKKEGDDGEEITELDDTLTDHEVQQEVTDLQSDPQSPISLPGYDQPQTQYHGPDFPPRAPVVPDDRTSEVIAREARKRDLLDNKAQEWVEQEIMARMISDFYRQQAVKKQQPAEPHPAKQPDTIPFAAEAVGQRGLQIFVDAGQHVDEGLVNALVKEVLMEKIATMTGRVSSQNSENLRPSEPQVKKPAVVPRAQSAATNVISEEEETLIRGTPLSTPLCTPDVTPCHSVNLSPPSATPSPRHLTTPDVTPTPSVIEQLAEDAEEQYADDDFEEYVEEVDKDTEPVSQPSVDLMSKHDVATPTNTPPATPPLIAPPTITTEVRTPTPTQQEATPEPSVIEEVSVVDEFPASPASAKLPMEDGKVSPLEETKDLSEDEEDKSEHVPPPVMPAAETSQHLSLSDDSQTTSLTPPPDSSLSETRNESFSEGQWLLSACSVGEVAGPLIETELREKIRERLMLAGSGNKKKTRTTAGTGDSDDTLQETEELQQDDNDASDISQSEGQFLAQPLPFDQDMLYTASHLRGAAPLPAYPNQPMPGANYRTDKSLGEISLGQKPDDEEEIGQRIEHNGSKVMRYSKQGPSQAKYEDVGEENTRVRIQRGRDESMTDRDEVVPSSNGRQEESPSPTRGRRHPTLGQVVSTTDSSRQMKKYRPGPSGGGPRVIQVAERSASPERVGVRKPPQAAPPNASSLTSLQGTLSDMETHTTDRMNVEALLRSRDYYASDLDSTAPDFNQSNTSPLQMPHDNNGGYGQSNRQAHFRTSAEYDMGQSSKLSFTMGSTSDTSLPLALRDSVDDDEQHRALYSTGQSEVRASSNYPDSLEGTVEDGAGTLQPARSGPLQVSVTIPSVAEEDTASESLPEDVSQISFP